ncbi:recombinase family protein [Shinella yambaruensis]|uniref:DNA invertase Pin n=1 Tax=Shinella yambaruensis TaxID=415996 RepID=A0ABQ5ZST7_9HYPH|nr:recombinase family protein [Shinella yambaruensis]MCJ8029964.1 recombinase family protein [Shinella yambaruensis]MCU7984238.1 recombinase family protein [Shinella yambaruensis]GLR55215.1 DNA invertase Pin [Shinella yambaruensis]
MYRVKPPTQRLFGYSTVSTHDDTDAKQQERKLIAAGCSAVYLDLSKAARQERPELDELLDDLRPGDTVIVCALNRIARGTRELLDVMERLRLMGGHLVSLSEPWLHTARHGGVLFEFFQGLSAFERSLIQEITRNGRSRAKKQGIRFGRPPTLSIAELKKARRLLDAEGYTVAQTADHLGVHRTTLYRALTRNGKAGEG